MFSFDRIKIWTRVRSIYFFIALTFYVLTEVGRFIYRPYIYNYGIKDLGFADVVGNLFGTIVIIFVELGILHANKVQGIRLIALITTGICLYELSQFILPRGVLDWKDLIATLVAGMITLGIFLIINHLFETN